MIIAPADFRVAPKIGEVGAIKNGNVRARAARPFYPQEQTSSACPGMSVWCQERKPDDSLDQLIGAAGAHFRIAKKALISGAGDLISTTTESSMASNPWRTPLGCRQPSPDPMMNSSEPTVDFTLPFTT